MTNEKNLRVGMCMCLERKGKAGEGIGSTRSQAEQKELSGMHRGCAFKDLG